MLNSTSRRSPGDPDEGDYMEYDIMTDGTVDGYAIPVDPAELTMCESCQ